MRTLHALLLMTFFAACGGAGVAESGTNTDTGAQSPSGDSLGESSTIGYRETAPGGFSAADAMSALAGNYEFTLLLHNQQEATTKVTITERSDSSAAYFPTERLLTTLAIVEIDASSLAEGVTATIANQLVEFPNANDAKLKIRFPLPLDLMSLTWEGCSLGMLDLVLLSGEVRKATLYVLDTANGVCSDIGTLKKKG